MIIIIITKKFISAYRTSMPYAKTPLLVKSRWIRFLESTCRCYELSLNYGHQIAVPSASVMAEVDCTNHTKTGDAGLSKSTSEFICKVRFGMQCGRLKLLI